MLQYDPHGASNFPHCPSATFTALRPPSLRPLPGARWELTCPLHQTGTRPDGTSVRRDLEWIIELVFTGGQWQALRVRM